MAEAQVLQLLKDTNKPYNVQVAGGRGCLGLGRAGVAGRRPGAPGAPAASSAAGRSCNCDRGRQAPPSSTC